MIEKIELTESEMESNFNEFIELIKTRFSGERLEKLLHMYSENELGLRAVWAPASPVEHFHNAFMGGYVLHVYNVFKCSLGMRKLYKAMGGDLDFTDEELDMCVFHHDLGKLGDETGPYYDMEGNVTDWARKNQGKVFELDKKTPYMEVTDRVFYLLQKYGITISQKEYLGLKCADGMFGPGHDYIKQFDRHKSLRTNICAIMHFSDWMASKIEKDKWKATQDNM